MYLGDGAERGRFAGRRDGVPRRARMVGDAAGRCALATSHRPSSSRHSALSYEQAGKIEAQVAELIALNHDHGVISLSEYLGAPIRVHVSLYRTQETYNGSERSYP